MKSLTTYIYESNSDFQLLKTFEDAKNYFDDGRQKILTKFFKENENDYEKCLKYVSVIYDIADDNNKTAPFVGKYKSQNVFCMRRWVSNKINEWSELTKNPNINDEWFWTKQKSVYAGPHNTNLKEDGNYNPSAEDMESVIAFAINKRLDDTYDDNININYVCNTKEGTQPQKNENLKNYYSNEYNFINNCANAIINSGINQKIHKLLSKNIHVTNEWLELGDYKNSNLKPNNTPKTDLISENNEIKISLKKFGGSQLMSGAYNEARATILCAAKDAKLSKEKYNEILENLKTPWIRLSGNQKGIHVQKKEGSEELKKYINDSEINIKKFLIFLNNELEENESFKYALLYEALTGEHKFGEDSLCAANEIFVWSSNEKQNKVYSVDDYIKKIIKNVKIEINWKTGGTTSYQALRIVSK